MQKETLTEVNVSFLRAKDGAQTRDPQLGRLMLYQLSYFRMIPNPQRGTNTLLGVGRWFVGSAGFEPTKSKDS